jgi:thiamine biosynthesis protein ThiI
MAFFCVNFTEIGEAVKKYIPEEYATVVMRRLMVGISEQLARRQGAKVLVTGESLGQVASQTIDGIICTDAVSNMPVLRPLIGFDKTEIVELARKIGTYDISVLPYEDCCTVFTPKHPKTRPSLKELDRVQSMFEFTKLIEKGVKCEKKVFRTV